MGLEHLLGLAVIAILGAIATGITKYLTDKKISSFAERLMLVEIAEKECQERTKISDKRLLDAMHENNILREVIPKKLVDGISDLIEISATQNAHLADVAESVKKFRNWDSDQSKICKAILPIQKPLSPEYIEIIARQHNTTPEEIVKIIGELNLAPS